MKSILLNSYANFIQRDFQLKRISFLDRALLKFQVATCLVFLLFQLVSSLLLAFYLPHIPSHPFLC